MRKPVLVLSLLLVGSWIGFLAQNQPMAQDINGAKWKYTSSSLDNLDALGAQGWEAYAVAHDTSGTRVFLKRRI